MAWAKLRADDYLDCIAKVVGFASKTSEAGAVTVGANTGNGIVYGATALNGSLAQNWTLTCTTAGGDGVAEFSVTGSVSGAQDVATSTVPYTNDFISMLILGGSAGYAVGDNFSFNVTSGNDAKWEVAGGIGPYSGEGIKVEELLPLRVVDLPSTATDVDLEIVMTSSDTKQLIWADGGASGHYVGVLDSSSSNSSGIDSGDPEYFVDGTSIGLQSTVNRSELAGYLIDGTEHTFKAEGADLSTWGQVAVSGYDSSDWRMNAYIKELRVWDSGVLLADWRAVPKGSQDHGASTIAPYDTFYDIVSDSYIYSIQEIILKGNGGGTEEIYSGFRTHAGSNYYNAEVSGFTGYVEGHTYDNQPGKQSAYCCMSNAPFYFYVFTSGRHIKVVPIIGTLYEHMYTGWYLPYATNAQAGYPAFVGGSAPSANTVITSTGSDHSAYWEPDNGNTSRRAFSGTGWFEPTEMIPAGEASFGNWYPDINGNRTLFPMDFRSTTTVYGQVEGLYAVTNADNALRSEDILNTGNSGYIILQSTFNAFGTKVSAFDLVGDQ